MQPKNQGNSAGFFCSLDLDGPSNGRSRDQKVFHVHITSYEQEMANLFFSQIKERSVTLCICMGSCHLKNNAHFFPNSLEKVKLLFFKL